MKGKATEAAASIVVNYAGAANRICTSLKRTFLLNLIAQIVLGTPVAAQTPDNLMPAHMDHKQEIALALSARPGVDEVDFRTTIEGVTLWRK